MTYWTAVAQRLAHSTVFRRVASTAARVGAVCLVMSAVVANADVLLSQPWDGSGDLIASYEDAYTGVHHPITVGGVVYDKFAVSTVTALSEISFQGGLLSPSPDISQVGFSFFIYSNRDGAPGPLVNGVVGLNVARTLAGTPGGVSVYSFDVDIPRVDQWGLKFSRGVYWLAIIAELEPPGQWGWATSGASGNHAYQTVGGNFPPGPSSGVTSPLGTSMAVEIRGVSGAPVPEPATWSLMLTGLGVVGALFRHARSGAAFSAAPMA